MSDITDSERRLVAALDRIDRSIERLRVERSDASLALAAQADAETVLEGARADAEAALANARSDAESARANAEAALAAARADGDAALATARADGEAALHAVRSENARLGDEIALLKARLVEIGHETVRLAAANDTLTEANQKLLASKGGAGEATAALKAELEALRAARAAEISQMDDILGSLERMLSGGARVAMGGPQMASANLAQGE